VGSLGLGMLYDLSIPTMIAISVGVQLISVPLFLMFLRDRTG